MLWDAPVPGCWTGQCPPPGWLSGELDPFSASDNLNELDGEHSPDQKANRHKQEAVNIVFSSPLVSYQAIPQSERRTNTLQTARSGCICDPVFAMSGGMESPLASNSCSRDPRNLSALLNCPSRTLILPPQGFEIQACRRRSNARTTRNAARNGFSQDPFPLVELRENGRIALAGSPK